MRLMVLVDSRVVLGAVSKGRSSSRKSNFTLRKLVFLCLACDIALELVWVPTWANPADAPSRKNRLGARMPHCRRTQYTEGKTKKQEGPPTTLSHHAGPDVTLCSSCRVGSVPRLVSLCPWDHNPSTGATSCCVAGVTSKNILDQSSLSLSLPEAGRPVTKHAVHFGAAP